jgi:LacI family transcriptional regulator
MEPFPKFEELIAMDRPTTIRDVAALAGVSLGTASRVLSGSASTSLDSRERVTAAMRQLEYRPNAHARSLRSTRTGVIGLLLPDVRNPFFADVAHAADQAALAAQYVTLLGNANEDTAQQDMYLEALIGQRVEGLIIAPQGVGSGSLRTFADKQIPIVFVDRTVDDFDVPSVTTDSAQGMEQAITHLRERGHDRIGYIGGPQSISTGRARYDAYVKEISRHGLDEDPDLVYFGDFQAASGTAAAEKLLSGNRPPTAFLAADSPMAVGALSAFRRRRIAIGSDIDLVAFDDIDWFAQLDPPLTVVAHDAEAMGKIAMRLLLEVMAGQDPKSVVLPMHLLRRQSSGRPRKPTTQRSVRTTDAFSNEGES